MKTASLVFGIFSVLLMFVGFFPCLGALNWINIPIAGVGFIISIIALTQNKTGESSGKAVAGIIMCLAAMIFGLIRLFMGGGIV